MRAHHLDSAMPEVQIPKEIIFVSAAASRYQFHHAQRAHTSAGGGRPSLRGGDPSPSIPAEVLDALFRTQGKRFKSRPKLNIRTRTKGTSWEVRPLRGTEKELHLKNTFLFERAVTSCGITI